MLHTNQLNFSSLRPKLTMNDFITLKSTKNTGISRTLKFSELSRPSPSARQHSHNDEQFKVVKLIGDQQKNIEEILAGLNCQCGCQAEFRKILDLLMGKIYRLREERNQLKKELEERNAVERSSVAVGANLEEEMLQQRMREQLFKLIEDSKVKMKSKEAESAKEIEMAPIETEEVRNLMGLNGETSITFENEANETNLLEESPMREKQQSVSRLSISPSALEQRVLRQCNPNSDNKLCSLKSYCHQRSLDLDTLQNYIQKLNCAKVLNKYETERRRNAIF